MASPNFQYSRVYSNPNAESLSNININSNVNNYNDVDVDKSKSMSSQEQTNISQINLYPDKITHEQLIHRIKQHTMYNINNGKHRKQSTFVSREHILKYIQIIGNENTNIEQILNPPTYHLELEALQSQCQALKKQLSGKQTQYEKIQHTNKNLDESISFMQDQYQKNLTLLELLQKQIQALRQENSVSRVVSEDHMSSLMDKFMNYFEQEEDIKLIAVPKLSNNDSKINRVSQLDQSKLKQSPIHNYRQQQANQQEQMVANQQQYQMMGNKPQQIIYQTGTDKKQQKIIQSKVQFQQKAKQQKFQNIFDQFEEPQQNKKTKKRVSSKKKSKDKNRQKRLEFNSFSGFQQN